jgi:hypothetical protein
MNFLRTIRSSMRAGAGNPPETTSTGANESLTDRYAGLNERRAVAELAGFNQVELIAIEAFERSHRDREPVLSKLRYLRQPEPLPDYDALEPDAIVEALSSADTDTIKAVREYERKLQNRPAVLRAITEALHRLRDRESAAPGAPLAIDYEQPPVVGNGLPIKVRPESGLGTP